jgi:toxin CcdB
MMQHDLFVDPDRRARAIYPLVVALQADGVDSDTNIVAPLTTTAVVPNPPTRALPLVAHGDRDYVVMTRLIGVLARRQLGQPVGSIAPYRDDNSRTLHWLFFGI